MNEVIIDTLNKYSKENEDFFNEIIEKLTEEFKEKIEKANKGKEIKVGFELETEHIVYNRSDGAKVKFLRWKKIPKENDEPVDIEDKLREVMEKDLKLKQNI